MAEKINWPPTHLNGVLQALNVTRFALMQHPTPTLCIITAAIAGTHSIDSVLMMTPPTAVKAVSAEVRVMEIRRQMVQAVPTPEIAIPDHILMNSSQESLSAPAPLALPTAALKKLATALMSPAPAPNANLLKVKRKAQEWFG
jgi:hypothetical protein